MSRATWDLLEWLSIGAALIAAHGLVFGMEGAVAHTLPAGTTRIAYDLAGAKRAIIDYRPDGST